MKANFLVSVSSWTYRSRNRRSFDILKIKPFGVIQICLIVEEVELLKHIYFTIFKFRLLNVFVLCKLVWNLRICIPNTLLILILNASKFGTEGFMWGNIRFYCESHWDIWLNIKVLVFIFFMNIHRWSVPFKQLIVQSCGVVL